MEIDIGGTYEKPWEKGVLRVMDQGRYFACGETPFFWLGDTAWLLFHQLTLEESHRYLRNRKELGYNVILADFIHTQDEWNREGQEALQGQGGAYWQHVDQVVEMAEQLGLYLGLLPVWGSSIVKGGCLTLENVDAYMQFVLERYHAAPNIIWIVGGDVRGDAAPEVFRRMGQLMKKDLPDRLVTYHPFGRTGSDLWFHEEEWLDFNLFQSGHRRYDQTSLGEWDDNTEKEGWYGEDSWRYVQRAYGKEPGKPVLDGEPSYEWILQGLHDKSQPYWQAGDVRRYAYWSVFAGAAGHVYGHNAIMQFYRDRSREGAFGVCQLWSEAIHHPGGAQMVHLKRLMESVDYTAGRPAQEYVMDEGERYQRVSVFAGEKYLLVYDYSGRPFTLQLDAYGGQQMSAYWMDPVTGLRTYQGELSGVGNVTFDPPKREDSEDVVLILLTADPE